MKILKFVNNQKGVAIIEMLLFIVTIGILISVITPWFKYFMSGTVDNDTYDDTGFVNQVMQNQTKGISESFDTINLIPGCDTNLVDPSTCP